MFFFKAGDECYSELFELKMSIKKLNNELLFGDWKLAHLRVHRRFRHLQNFKVGHRQNNTILPTLPSTAGNLLVHDRGKTKNQFLL